MNTVDYIKVLVEEIHSTVAATNDKNGHPVARVIDMMLYDEDGLYFLTARGKSFYTQLVEQGYIAVSGMTAGIGTMDKKSVSIHGKVRSIGKRCLDEIFEKNSYMAKIYPEEATREALEVFQIYEATGEYFDLTTKPITRGSCPQKCIDISQVPLVINPEHCLHCGNCIKYCSFGAVEKVV